jgi:hypothetical protein
VEGTSNHNGREKGERMWKMTEYTISSFVVSCVLKIVFTAGE